MKKVKRQPLADVRLLERLDQRLGKSRQYSGLCAERACDGHRSISSTLPPAASIFCRAVAENLWARTVRAALSSPSPRTLIGRLAVFDDTAFVQERLRRHLAARGEAGEAREVQRLVLDAEGVGEAALAGHAPDKRKLAAFEAALDAAAGARLLALQAATGIGAVSAGVAASYPFSGMTRAAGRAQLILPH